MPVNGLRINFLLRYPSHCRTSIFRFLPHDRSEPRTRDEDVPMELSAMDQTDSTDSIRKPMARIRTIREIRSRLFSPIRRAHRAHLQISIRGVVFSLRLGVLA